MAKSKSQQLRFVAKIEVFVGITMIFAAVLMYIMREKWLTEDTSFLPVIIGIFGVTSLINVKLLYHLAAKHEEKNPLAVEE